MSFTNLIIVYGGELALDVAERVVAKQPSSTSLSVTIQSASERPKKLIDNSNETTAICFILQTIENACATEDGGTTLRFFKRKTHPSDLLSGGKFQFAVLGVGDSNLLLDRQTTSAKDCNQVAQELDERLEALGGSKLVELGMSDERTGMEEVEPWIEELWARLQ
eukprot:CAMPEP_0198250636 /NCGR_PEP_ID=MMETSP1447-20131203/1739_1 /TAXON_ID=420782 /ORGANISM="Chaetoceros dichaeta, Strain CCMP1751" /LENGTH=164 /DNA_ID=CAMNT_0043935483 /DNA_START=88 /DNA_END=582 /DNA_ORIENTATION=+